MRFNQCLCLSLALLGFAGLPGAAAEPAGQAHAPAPLFAVDLKQMEAFRRELTLRFIKRLGDPEFRKLLETRLGPDQTRVSLSRAAADLAAAWPSPERQAFGDQVQALDQDLRGKMGLEQTAGELLGAQVVWPEQGPRRLEWAKVLFAVRPHTTGADGAYGVSAQGPAQIEAYDLNGRAVPLDAATRPGVPVIMVGADRREVVRAGTEAVDRGLRQAGYQTHHPPQDSAAPVPCAKLTAIRLAEGLEPWWKDGLEVYALVSGIDPLQNKPNVKLVNMPYLVHEATDYFPNQVLVFWPDYRFGAANIQLFDHGDGTNYKELLDAILKGAAAAMATAGAPAFAWIPILADAILEAMPNTWWTVSDTWLDTFYTLERSNSYQAQPGSGKTASISLVPWTLAPQPAGQ